MASFPTGKIFILRTVAKKRRVPPQFLHKIFQRLTQEGILVSHRGVQGGFSIDRDPGGVTVRNIMEIMQGPIAFNYCLTRNNTCSRSEMCSIRKNLKVLQKRFVNALDKMTLKQLAREKSRRTI